MANLYDNPAVAARTYGLDGDIRLLRFDANQDGVLDAAGGDRAILYFGMRRGGRFYYALDVTNRAAPQLLWTLGPGNLPGIGETWSPPTIARVNVGGGAQNGEKLVLIMGGGYDGAQENYAFVNDNSGNRVFMVDAISGSLLWYAGGRGRRGRAGPGTGSNAALDTKPRHGARYGWRPVRRSHVCGRHGRSRLALRHIQRQQPRRTGNGRRAGDTGQRRHRHRRVAEQPPLLQRT